MADRSILFSAPMIVALLEGRKSQTRRCCRQANDAALTYVVRIDDAIAAPGWFGDEEGEVAFFTGFAPGDRLWVREAWRTHRAYDDLKPSDMGGEEAVWPEVERDNCDYHGRYRAGRYMPRWASRLTLIVTDVRVERLQDCSPADAIAEGISVGKPLPQVPTSKGDIYHDGITDPIVGWTRDPVEAYARLWNHINGAGAWEANPWVTAVNFDVLNGNIDNLPQVTA